MSKQTIFLLRDTSLTQDNTRDFQVLFLKIARDLGIEESIQAVRASDLGIYDKGYVVKDLTNGVTYANIRDTDIERFLKATVKGEGSVDEFKYTADKCQLRVVLRNCGLIDPESIEEYMAQQGYCALAKALTEMTPETVIEEMKKSGLRGRGGAGFPTWMKWSFARNSLDETRFVVCNADEGDPGAYMDRSILEGDPHAVVEGMILAGFAIGAQRGFFYIRAEYPLAIKRIETAIEQAYERGLLGNNILGSGFSFDLEIRLGAGAFVCGEETALIQSIEGKRGTPISRPPFPADKGLWKHPTIINNVETLATIAQIINRGGEWLAAIGTEKSKGTKVFAITGKVKNSGLVEIPMGMTLGEIVFGIAGGVLGGGKLMAVQTGGPSGGVIPLELIDTKVSYEHLAEVGSIMGSGGLIVMDEDDCMVDIPRFYLRFCVEESCGKCAPCRIGGFQMLQILDRIAEGKGVDADLKQMQRIAQGMQKASLCALGQTAPNPVLSTMKYFAEEYRQHVEDKKCRAGKCTKMVQYSIDQTHCKKCKLCAVNCPVGAISGSREAGYVVDQVKCIKCGTCYEVCKFKAIVRK